jgi:hypothetical protein
MLPTHKLFRPPIITRGNSPPFSSVRSRTPGQQGSQSRAEGLAAPMPEVIKRRGVASWVLCAFILLPLSPPHKMILFSVFSAAVFCLWSLLLASGPIYVPVLSIPVLASPVLTPLLSPADGPTILILIEVCDVTVPITFPVCDPSDVPVPPFNPPSTPVNAPSPSRTVV